MDLRHEAVANAGVGSEPLGVEDEVEGGEVGGSDGGDRVDARGCGAAAFPLAFDVDDHVVQR
jgi:hypothetical protein